MEEFWKRFDQFSGQLQAMAGQAWDSMLLYKQAESIGYLAIGFISLIIAAVAATWVLRVGLNRCTIRAKDFHAPEPERFNAEGKTTWAWNDWDSQRQWHNRNDGDPNARYIIPSIACGLLTVGFGISAFSNLFHIWNWIGAFVPEARLFHDIMVALTPAVTH